MKPLEIIRNGITTENPTFVLLLGMCPTLATTSSALNGLAMGLATMFVLICSNSAISLIKHLVPDAVRIPSYIVVIAGFIVWRMRTKRRERIREKYNPNDTRIIDTKSKEGDTK